ncbi:hypothetical protein PJP10_27060 [Mycobacterium kansasii]
MTLRSAINLRGPQLTRRPAKVAQLLLAGSACVAAIVFAATATAEDSASDAGAESPSIRMTLGETTTKTTAPSEPRTPFAEPAVKAMVPCGFTFGC